ncbi:hypothetical protein Q649_01088 [Bartonella quintana JK 73]|uniref:Uncharacterized protein n=1 Tax=Bartonella quintana JK 73 TaxID=1402976 RepID=W3TXR3_BARQI|nr:hypothetical protein [Bartonella quintana]ETS14440.1 hypothetical protein Q650_01080 [Bartonella quintana JK 73rel]ETS16126.1 hypothetical protein Q649_01088 [Bartonella quintana JK 73]
MCELSQSNEGLGSNKHQGIAIISEIKAMITGISGFFLREDEKTFIVEHKPWAFILFVRNIVSEDDVKVLTISLRDVSGRDSILFLLIRRGGSTIFASTSISNSSSSLSISCTLGKVYKKD